VALMELKLVVMLTFGTEGFSEPELSLIGLSTLASPEVGTQDFQEVDNEL